jgi:hypothetical protein
MWISLELDGNLAKCSTWNNLNQRVTGGFSLASEVEKATASAEDAKRQRFEMFHVEHSCLKSAKLIHVDQPINASLRYISWSGRERV